jgi:hypothetical protein
MQKLSRYILLMLLTLNLGLLHAHGASPITTNQVFHFDAQNMDADGDINS